MLKDLPWIQKGTTFTVDKGGIIYDSLSGEVMAHCNPYTVMVAYFSDDDGNFEADDEWIEKVEEPTKKKIEKMELDYSVTCDDVGEKLNQCIDAINLLNKEIAELKGK